LDIVLNLSVKRDLEILVENYKNNAHTDKGQGWKEWWTSLLTRVVMRMTTQPYSWQTIAVVIGTNASLSQW